MNQYQITVPATTSTVIIPRAVPPVGSNFSLWTAATAVVNGDYLRVQGTNRYYMVVVAGNTGATAPTATDAEDGLVTDGTAKIVPVARNGRQIVAATQEADADLWYHEGDTATGSGGQYAYVQGQQFRSDTRNDVSVYSSIEVKINVADM